MKLNLNAPMGKTVLAVVLALITGFLLPLATMLQIMLLLPVMMFGGILCVYFFCYAGPVPAGVFTICGLASTYWLMSPRMMWMLAVAAFVPALVMLRGALLKQPFFDQLRNGIIVSVLGMLTAIFIAYSGYGGDMIARFMDLIRTEISRMPDAMFQPFIDAINSSLVLSGVSGARMTVQTYRGQMMGVLDLMQEAYVESLPGTLLSGALLTGVLGTLWGNWTLARRGMATDQSFVGMSQWFLPTQITVGALVIWIVGYFATNGSYGAGRTRYVTVYQLASCAFVIQALSAIDRRLLRAGSSTRGRKVAIFLLGMGSLILRILGMALFTVGAISALFGSHGAVKLWLDKRRNDDHSDDDDQF